MKKVLHYDAFSTEANKGNPVGIVLNADKLSEKDMQSIAVKVGFNETVFVLKSDRADLRLRYFTPGHEMNLCGHATVGSMFCLNELGYLDKKESLTIETNVGVLPIKLYKENGQTYVKMKQDKPKFIEFKGNVGELAKSIGITKEEIDDSKPIVYGNTGIWTLLVPIKNIDSFNRMKPNTEQFPKILKEIPKSSLHPFCVDAYDDNAFMHARHFSSPYSATIEDVTTGTASGVMGAYYLSYIDQELNSMNFTVEQGMEIDRDGRVAVEVTRVSDSIDVFISGTAVYVKDILL